MRCLPHDEDTGGFFVATLRKKLNNEVNERIVKYESNRDKQVSKSSMKVDMQLWDNFHYQKVQLNFLQNYLC